jgi:hypothetical protein
MLKGETFRLSGVGPLTKALWGGEVQVPIAKMSNLSERSRSKTRALCEIEASLFDEMTRAKTKSEYNSAVAYGKRSASRAHLSKLD